MTNRTFRQFLKKSRRIILVLAILRLTFLEHHPIVNDEWLYVEYMQQQHEDFAKYKRISIDNNYWDRKPPLQYRMWKNFVNMFENPMAGPRFMQWLITLLWYIFLLFLLFRITGSALFANITWLLFAISPTFGNLDKLVLTDGIIYWFGFILLFLVYETGKNVLQRKSLRKIVVWIVLSIFWARALMFTKQTWEIFVFYPVILIFLLVYQHNQGLGYFQRLKNKNIRKHWILLWWWYGLILVIARFFYKLSIPESLYPGKHIFSANTGYVFTFKEVFTQFPIQTRIHNIIEWFSYHYVVAFGVPTLLAILLTIVIFILTQKDRRPLVFFWLMRIMVSSTYFVLVKNFTIQWNKFMLYSSIVILISRWFMLSKIFQKTFPQKTMLLSILTTLIIVPHRLRNMTYYTIQPHSMTKVIGTYSQYCIEKKTCNRWLHADTNELISYLIGREKSWTGSLIFVDPTRWTPWTTIQIHQKLFPSQKIIWKITTWMVDNIEDFIKKTKNEYWDLPIILIFDGLKSRDWWYENPFWTREFAESNKCKNKKIWTKNDMPNTNFTLCEF